MTSTKPWLASEAKGEPDLRQVRPLRSGRFSGPAGRSINSVLDRFLPQFVYIAVFALWEIGCRIGNVPDFILPAPSRIIKAGIDFGFAAWGEQLLATLEVVLGGFAISALISIPLAIAIVRSQQLSRIVVPALVVIQSTPIVAIAPILIVILGAGILPRIVITCLITFFPIVIAATTGLRATPTELIELSQSLRATMQREFLDIRLPYAIPYLFAGFRVSMTLSVIGAVVGEFVAAERGLGYTLLYATSLFKVSQSFAALAILIIISLLLFQVVVQIERRFFPWSLPQHEGH
jgi:NitT/TauT family transport system permease protein